MAEFVDAATNGPQDHARRYRAIEQAYVDDRWADVLEQGNALLSRLATNDLELRQRVQLLIAHTHLYGYGDRDRAEDLYRAVLGSEAEPTLRQIADQGLQQCNLPLQRQPQPATSSTLDPEQLPQPVGEPLEDSDGASLHESLEALGLSRDEPASGEARIDTAAAVEPVMPWLTTASRGSAGPADDAAGGSRASEVNGSSLVPEVIEEPELIEVHQADPSLADEYELTETGALSERHVREVVADEQTAAVESGFEEEPELLAGLLRVVIR